MPNVFAVGRLMRDVSNCRSGLIRSAAPKPSLIGVRVSCTHKRESRNDNDLNQAGLHNVPLLKSGRPPPPQTRSLYPI